MWSPPVSPALFSGSVRIKLWNLIAVTLKSDGVYEVVSANLLHHFGYTDSSRFVYFLGSRLFKQVYVFYKANSGVQHENISGN
jgi:hypothetical protein